MMALGLLFLAVLATLTSCQEPEVNCGRPEADFNSVVHGNDWWVGSVVRYSCRPGFVLLGDPASACQSDGRWSPKPSCLRICLRGRIQISERDLTGRCSSSCGSQEHLGASPSRGCIKISGCVTKLSGWPRWFQRCDICECDCHVPCGEPWVALPGARGRLALGDGSCKQLKILSLLSSGSSR
ncbi:sushi, von Willebrand factor type A, EGF and pentraxin domain-containing protein 1-like isoform X4 [Zonotrichia leucophrys gambelii]|uniref:sushi, von Willebrand factor type A, EGF and pentraxin domain-containing protein 1-like isoform X4 n=1 Tax=Zonotrichia leucophrys gambelii TaxID=257770 RepID=UPI00314045D0